MKIARGIRPKRLNFRTISTFWGSCTPITVYGPFLHAKFHPNSAMCYPNGVKNLKIALSVFSSFQCFSNLIDPGAIYRILWTLITGARDSEWQWQQLGYMQICTLPQAENHTSTSSLSVLQAGRPSCHPTNSIKALKAIIITEQDFNEKFTSLVKISYSPILSFRRS